MKNHDPQSFAQTAEPGTRFFDFGPGNSGLDLGIERAIYSSLHVPCSLTVTQGDTRIIGAYIEAGVLGMGWLNRQLDSWNEAKRYFELGCEVLGPPSTNVGVRGSVGRADRIAAGKREAVRRAAIEDAKEKSASVYGKPTRDNGYFSRDRGYGAADYFLGKDGNPTSERPHLHVVHNPREGQIIFTVTRQDGTHPVEEYLPIDASGSEVNAKQARMLRLLD